MLHLVQPWDQMLKFLINIKCFFLCVHHSKYRSMQPINYKSASSRVIFKLKSSMVIVVWNHFKLCPYHTFQICLTLVCIQNTQLKARSSVIRYLQPANTLCKRMMGLSLIILDKYVTSRFCYFYFSFFSQPCSLWWSRSIISLIKC